jgi:hypothetical protein
MSVSNTPQIVQNGSLDLTEYAWKQIQDARQGQSTARANALYTNASLPENSWEAVDDAVYRTMDDTLTIVSDLRTAGLRVNTDLMTKIDQWNVVDDMGEASVDMDPETAETESSVAFGMEGVPVPIVHDDFSLGFREAPSPDGQNPSNVSLDTLGATVTSRNVAETLEDLVWNGWGQTIGSSGDSFQLYGLTNHPDANTGTTSADWTADNTVIRDDFRAMRAILKNDNDFNPAGTGYWVYLGTEYYDTLDDIDPDGDGNLTVRDRIENLASISRIREAEYLPGKSVLMFRPTEDVIDLGIARDPQPVQWEDPFRDHWKVLAAMYPRVKSTKSGQSGIVYWTA